MWVSRERREEQIRLLQKLEDELGGLKREIGRLENENKALRADNFSLESNNQVLMRRAEEARAAREAEVGRMAVHLEDLRKVADGWARRAGSGAVFSSQLDPAAEKGPVETMAQIPQDFGGADPAYAEAMEKLFKDLADYVGDVEKREAKEENS